ncbi:hypothetical protein CDL62_08155 [Alkalitalea saponilacus]|uniref:fimbrial biogenesis chaperone n=1 Tax=Alkalitalea saponilacus TaxID=889453 RepID=UPI000B4A56F4|nr:hypothetical protein [Alkalitalea saponilacus]ASB49113.1 hypothetical protein CDL62_08155 [Alkalitalea saponilacus]
MNRLFILIAAFCFISGTLFSQSASISPSRFYYKLSPGESGTQLLRVTNNGNRAETFQVSFSNFASDGNQGKTTIMDDYEHGCASWLTASPAFFELAPGETRDVEVRLQVPSGSEGLSVRWAVGQVRLATERTALEERGDNVTGMQIIQTFEFLFHVFQTPPALENMREASVLSFRDVTGPDDSGKVLRMEVENTGRAIIDCAPYLDIVNATTGESQRIMNRAFTVLPGGKREINFRLPEDFPPGRYSILGIIDYGSRTDLAGAELDLVIE